MAQVSQHLYLQFQEISCPDWELALVRALPRGPHIWERTGDRSRLAIRTPVGSGTSFAPRESGVFLELEWVCSTWRWNRGAETATVRMPGEPVSQSPVLLGSQPSCTNHTSVGGPSGVPVGRASAGTQAGRTTRFGPTRVRVCRKA